MIFKVKLGKSWKSFLLGFIKQINLFKLRNSQSRKYLELGGSRRENHQMCLPCANLPRCSLTGMVGDRVLDLKERTFGLS